MRDISNDSEIINTDCYALNTYDSLSVHNSRVNNENGFYGVLDTCFDILKVTKYIFSDIFMSSVSVLVRLAIAEK